MRHHQPLPPAGFFSGLPRPTLAVALLALLVAPLSAQLARSGAGATTADDQTVELPKVIVTGSNIQRLDMEKIAPVTVIDQDAMEVRNAVLPVDLLTSLPSVVSLPENETRLGSSGARGDNANINLRNMGATATLILVNGRRMSINPMTAGLSQAVNVNQLPTRGIERIEVLRDGASAIYGSDAVGGVINYVLKREFTGAETSLRYGWPEHGGGESVQATLTFGQSFAAGRGRFFGTVEALYRDSINLTQREFSATANTSDRAEAPWNVLGGPFDARSARGIWPTFRLGSATANNYFRPVNGTPTLTNVAPTRAAHPEFFLDLNQYGMASPRVRRGNTFLSGEYDLSDRLTAFADFGYYKSESTMRRQPLALNAPTSDQLKVMAVNNPYNPYGSRFYDPAGAPNADGTARLTGTPRTVSFTAMTLADLAAETVTTKADVVRLSAGLRGKLGESWTWESSAFYNQVKGQDDAYPDVRESKLQEVLSRTDATAYNPFGYTFKVQGGAVVADAPYTNPAATVDEFAEVYSRNAKSSITSGDLRFTGRLFRLWAGDVQAAIGAEHRNEDLADLRPPFSGENPAGSGLDPTNNDFLLHPPRPDVIGDRDVTSFYAEVVVPLVASTQQIPLINTFEVSASARHERYSDFGDTTKPKLGLNWRPVSWLMLRGSYNEGFMAPSLAALFTSPRWSISAGAGDIDTYRNPVTNEGPYVQRTYFGGNPDLKPQESEGTTYGFVVDVPAVKGLSLSADWWRISRTNLLGQRSVAQIRASDVALLKAYTQSQLAAGVAIGAIDTGSGTAGYKGDPDVVRFTLTPEDATAFATYNAANPGNLQGAAGRIFSVNRPFVNVSTSEHEGTDFGLRYALPRLAIGSVVLNSEWAYLSRSESTFAPANLAPTVTDGLYSGGAAKWRSNTSVSWRRGAWSASLAAYHVGKTHDSGATTTQAIYDSLGQPTYIEPFETGGQTVYRRVMDPVWSYNATFGFNFGADASPLLRGTKVRLGIINLTDKEPPLASSEGFSYDASVHQTLLPGRTWTIEFTRMF
ncbi:Vitamin B12 transporter BtuB precursor [Lacunisphaera limnophila]|uniref:Vitamin B12 transporter BtuB n=1 Tax=Lacunisphaera limnophila TaxID=1838286 RepID=A0A1D8AYL0_9BACT|nr:TonB-dependent receptor [Lacunisphaera limnophila]AOS45986.1 Vitamin B12 transporter BtuB precursor [Lacunisphaera limnophila]